LISATYPAVLFGDQDLGDSSHFPSILMTNKMNTPFSIHFVFGNGPTLNGGQLDNGGLVNHHCFCQWWNGVEIGGT